MTKKALTPEVMDVTQKYIDCKFSIADTAKACGLAPKEVSEIISHPQAKQYINEVYLDTGYRNKAKLGALLDRIIESKIEEAEDSELWSSMDLMDIIKIAHKMRIDEAKIDSPNTQVNIANFGDNKYTELVEKLVHGKRS